ncbi:HAD-IIA family hydrolase [Ruminococcaceae bacterium OttesenSCG-928-I18]|nr:HAD-IIA family hydrolase [Ruminococcaceae bacterium OttesenSCG-928-I18]
MVMRMVEYNSDPLGRLREMRCFVLDLDGTLYLGNRWIDGALAFVKKLRAEGRRVVVLTNNSSHSRSAYREKLQRRGLPVSQEDILTSGRATIAYLHKNHPSKSVFLLGTDELQEEFSEAGLKIEEDRPDLVVTAFDTSLTYKRLSLVCRHLRAGLPFVATHPDLNCPTEDGPIPDVGSIHALIEASTGRRPDVIIGKPERGVVDYLLRKTGIPSAQTVMVGDRLYTDIAMGVRHGLLSVLVLSGESGTEELAASEVQPTLVFDSVKQMIPWI